MKVAVLGGGQLGRMLALEGIPLGHRFIFLEPAPDPPASALGTVIAAPYDDPGALARIAEAADVVTYEFENVPAGSAAWLAERLPVLPPPRALGATQDRLAEKQMFQRLGIDTAPFHRLDTPADLDAALAATGLPAVIKTRRFGYDGKGQRVARSPAEAAAALDTLGPALIAERFIHFERELSILAVRGRDGHRVSYPLTENRHRGGILRASYAPAPGASPALQTAAEELARRIMEALEYVGVLAVELFEAQGRLLANEMAPRVHNSGHWTLNGADTSQFENHIRAITGLPPRGSAGARPGRHAEHRRRASRRGRRSRGPRHPPAPLRQGPAPRPQAGPRQHHWAPTRRRSAHAPNRYGHCFPPSRPVSRPRGAEVRFLAMLDEIKTRISEEVEALAHELNVILPDRIQKAVELGDLRENSEYKSALERQQFVQARIGHLAGRMAEVSKIDVDDLPADRVGFGSRIEVRDAALGEVVTFTIVAGDYIDFEKGHISLDSPLGQGFLGAREGDEVTIRLPAGERRFEVIKVTTLPQQLGANG